MLPSVALSLRKITCRFLSSNQSQFSREDLHGVPGGNAAHLSRAAQVARRLGRSPQPIPCQENLFNRTLLSRKMPQVISRVIQKILPMLRKTLVERWL